MALRILFDYDNRFADYDCDYDCDCDCDYDCDYIVIIPVRPSRDTLQGEKTFHSAFQHLLSAFRSHCDSSFYYPYEPCFFDKKLMRPTP